MHFPWAEVAPISKLVDNPQLKERRFFVEVEHPQSGKRYKFPGAPCRMSDSPWQIGSRVPTVGEHNRDIYCRELGLSDEEIAALAEDNVI